MIKELLSNILEESKLQESEYLSEQLYIEHILDNIYQFLYRNNQPVHTIGIGILRGDTFDMYYKGRMIKKYTKRFGAMSYKTTIAGKACELYKHENKSYLHLHSKNEIIKTFEKTSKEFSDEGQTEEANALLKRMKVTIDQGIGSFLLIPLFYGKDIIGIFTISSLKESTPNQIFGEDITTGMIPLAHLLSLLLNMEKISYDKANDIGRLLISSIDAKDEYQASHSLNVRTVIDFFINELSKDKELRERVENIGLTLTVERIERLRHAALLHDIGKIFIPGSILRKSELTREEILIRKMHSFCTYNILSNSKVMKDIAEIASTHHAFYFIPDDTSDLDEYTRVETDVIGYPFDRISETHFSPETQIITLADVLNAIIRNRPNGKGLSLTKALKFHEGLKEVFLTVVRRVEKNLQQGKYPSEIANEYRSSLWIQDDHVHPDHDSKQWGDLHQFLTKIKFNTMGIISLIESDEISFPIESITIGDKPIQVTHINNEHILLSLRDIPKEEGFIWINNIYSTLKESSFTGKLSFAFIGKSGCKLGLNDLYRSLVKGLMNIKNEPVHYYLVPQIYCCE